MDRLVQRYEAALVRLVGSGAQVLVFTTFDTRTTFLLEPLRRRILFFNNAVRRLADEHGALLLDHTLMREYDDPRLWAFDKIHMSRQGHKRMAAFVLASLGIPHTLRLKELGPRERRPWTIAVSDELLFVRSEVLPLVRRRMSGVRDGATVVPKWPVPIRPAQGMKRLATTHSGPALAERSGRVRA